MSNDAKATRARRPGRPKAGSEDKKVRILSEAGLLHHYSSKDQLLSAVLDARECPACVGHNSSVDEENTV